jgi:hypothetical protein
MPTSEAKIRANQQNALKSTGPKTPEGKEQSRANAYKHGLTGSGTVLPEREAAEVERRTQSFFAELKIAGDIAEALVRRAATLSVRMERCVEAENARLTERVRQAEADFEPPEGCDLELAKKLRFEAGRRAQFDPSKEATLLRQYENAAERGFYRALKELRQIQKAQQAAEKAELDDLTSDYLASFDEMRKLDAEFDELYAKEFPDEPPIRRNMSRPPAQNPVDVPITIGRRR